MSEPQEYHKKSTTMSTECNLLFCETLSFTEINKFRDEKGRVSDIVELIAGKSTILTRIVIDKALFLIDADQSRIYTAILGNPRIRSIEVENVTVKNELARFLPRLRRMDGLERLAFYRCNIPDSKDLRNIAYMLQTNSRLCELSLCALHTDATKLFLEALGQSSRPEPALRKLSIKRCSLTHYCFVAIGQVLEHCPSLEILEIQERESYLGLAAGERLASGIAKSSSLLRIVIDVRRLSERVRDCLFRSLATISTLKKVSIGQVSLTNDDLVVRMIEANASMEHLSIRSRVRSGLRSKRGGAKLRNLDETNVRAFIEAVKAHPAITTLQIPNVCSTLQRELDFCLELNKGPKRILQEDATVPLALWPLILKRADECEFTSQWSREQKLPSAVLHYFVREKCDLFDIERNSSS